MVTTLLHFSTSEKSYIKHCSERQNRMKLNIHKSRINYNTTKMVNVKQAMEREKRREIF